MSLEAGIRIQYAEGMREITEAAVKRLLKKNPPGGPADTCIWRRTRMGNPLFCRWTAGTGVSFW